MRIIEKAKLFIRNGYNVLPVYRIGGDDQPVQSFTNKETGDRIVFTHEDALGWERKHTQEIALAVTCGVNNVMTLDFDITSKRVARIMYDAVRERYPTALVRKCNDPKFTVMFQGAGQLLTSTTGWSNWYSLNDKKQMIELNANRKLTTVAGTHRKTGNLYSWGNQRTPMNTRAEHLPKIDHVGVGELLNLFNEKFITFHKDALVVRDMRLVPINKVVEKLDPLATATVTYSDSQIRSYLLQLNGDDREDWMQGGRALHQHYSTTPAGSEVGLTIWEMWSKQFEGYLDGQCEYQWSFFRQGAGTTMHSVVSKLKREKKAPESLLEAFLERYVLIKKGALVADKHATTGESLVTLSNFREHSVNQVVFSEKKNGDTTTTPVSRLWQSDPTRLTVYSTIFAPGQGRIVIPDDETLREKYWNSYVRPVWEVLDSPNAIKLKYFTDHIDYLFGGEGHESVDWFYTWAAQMLQSPQDRKTITLLHISTHTRTGRGWLSELLRRLVGKINTSDTTISAMGNDGAKTGYMYNTILCTIAEVREAGKDRFSVSDSIKKKVTDEHQDVDVKYGDQALMKIYTRFFMQSNHADPLILDHDDGRFNIFANHNRPMPQAYYDKLYSLGRDTEFINSVYTFLMKYEVDDRKLTRVMKTQAREDVIMATKSDTAGAFMQFMRIVEGYSRVQLSDFMSSYHELHSDNLLFQPNVKELGYLEKEYCRTTTTCYTTDSSGRRSNVVIKMFKHEEIDNADELIADTNTKVENYFNQWRDKGVATKKPDNIFG